MPCAYVSVLNVQTKSESQPGVAIIVPLLNEVRVVAQLIEHLQGLDADEVIFVDGGSSDGTLEAISRTGFRVLNWQAGRAGQMNAGAAVATYATLLFLHADTRLPENYRSELVHACAWGRFDVRFDTSATAMSVVAFWMNLRSRISGVATGDQAIFVDAELFAKVGGFPDMPLMEDVALSKNLRKSHAPSCLRTKVVTSARRWQQKGVLKTIFKMWWYRLAFFAGLSPAALKRSYDDVR